MSEVELAVQELAESLISTAPIIPWLWMALLITVPVGIFCLGYMIIKDRKINYSQNHGKVTK